MDELDRARPNYSLELLERIKHVFNTKKHLLHPLYR
ncbi:hypothetical protein ACS6K7_07015 [Enterobacter chuandaensis]